MKILLASSKYMPEYSGSGFRAHNLYKRLLVKSPELTLRGIMAGSETENKVSEYEFEGMRVNRIACKFFDRLSSNPALRRLQNWMNFRSEFSVADRYLRATPDTPDLVHIFGKSYVTTAALSYSVQKSIPILIELCNEMKTPFFHIPFPSSLITKVKPITSYKYVCISERLRAVCLKNGVAEENIWCRPNPVDESKFFPISESQKIEIRRRITGLGADIKLLSYVAKIIPRKNHLFLLDVMERLPKEYRLFIGGPIVKSGIEHERDSALLSKIKHEIFIRKLSDRVFLSTGFFKNIDELYKMSDVYLFPSMEEGLGTPLIEAVACGTPVVANKISGISDVWIKNAVNGFVLELNPARFAEKVQEACRIPRETRIIEADKILKIASTDRIDNEYMNIINELVKGGH